jgi:hypothetical protein
MEPGKRTWSGTGSLDPVPDIIDPVPDLIDVPKTLGSAC